MRKIFFLLGLVLAPLVVHAQDRLDCLARGSLCHVETGLKMIGIEDKQVLIDFLDALKTAARENDRKAISKLVYYPLTVNKKRKPTKYKTPAALLANFDTIFTPAVLDVIQRSEYEQVFINMSGIMLGDGEVWCFSDHGAIRIGVVNGP